MNHISLGKMDDRIIVTGMTRNDSVDRNQGHLNSSDVSNDNAKENPNTITRSNSGSEDITVRNNTTHQLDPQAAAIIEDANIKASQIIEQARKDADAILRGALLEIMEESGMPSTSKDTAKLSINDVEAKTRELENHLRDVLQSYRESIQKMLYDFRVNLFATDFSQICDAYQRLYLFSTLMINKRINTIEESELSEDTKACMRQNLREIQGALNKRILRLENGLSAAGLCIIKPLEGETYNSDEHTAANAEDDGTLEAIVEYCVYPGVRADERVICKASVQLDLQ